MHLNALIRALFAFLLIISFACEGTKAGAPALLQKHGHMTLLFNNAEYKIDLVLLKTSSGKGFTINSGTGNPHCSIAIVLPDISTGKYPFGAGSEQSNMFINNSNYLLNDGVINVQASGKILSGNFKAKYYSSNGKGGYNKRSSGEISGSFQQLLVQQ